MYRPVSVNHLTIRVQDLDRTAEFFERVFGWDVDSSLSDRRRVQIGNTRLVFKEVLPETPKGDRFSEFRVGVDHILLGVEGLDELAPIADRLRRAGFATSRSAGDLTPSNVSS